MSSNTCKVVDPKLINYIVDEFKYILNSLKSTSEQLQKSIPQVTIPIKIVHTLIMKI